MSFSNKCCAGGPRSFQAWLQLRCQLPSHAAPFRQLTLRPFPLWRAPSTAPSGDVMTFDRCKVIMLNSGRMAHRSSRHPQAACAANAAQLRS